MLSSRYCSDTPAERNFLPFSGSRERSQSYLMPSPDRAISEETALSSAPTEKKKASLCPQQDLLSSPLWPCSLSFSLLFCLSVPPTRTHKHTNRHTITVACKEHGLGSGEVDCSPPQGFLRMKSGVMAVSTIRLMLMVYDPSGCPCTHPDTHTRTHPPTKMKKYCRKV